MIALPHLLLAYQRFEMGFHTADMLTLTLSMPALFSAKYKSFFENLLLARLLCWRDISRDPFFREGFEFFFSYKHETNEKSSQE